MMKSTAATATSAKRAQRKGKPAMRATMPTAAATVALALGAGPALADSPSVRARGMSVMNPGIAARPAMWATMSAIAAAAGVVRLASALMRSVMDAIRALAP